MFEGGSATSRRLPFHFQSLGGSGRLTLGDLAVGALTVDKLELEVSDLGTDPGAAPAERFQRRRTRLCSLSVRITQAALDDRVSLLRKQLAGVGITQLSVRLADGYVSVRARAADGLAAADLSFHVELVSAGAPLRALASSIRVHGHLPTPGPVIADRLLIALTGASDTASQAERPYARGLCDVEVDLVGALLWQLLPPSGWRLPSVTDVELSHVRLARTGIEIAYGPAGTRAGELGVRKHAHQLAAAHDLMHSVDQQLRGGHLEDAMRGYRALLASGGPDQPLLLERILALAAARPAWFFDGLELARQALGRWPGFAPAHAALASITLAQGDAREAARHLEDSARNASAGGDDDQAALAALAAARLLRVLDPRAATQLYQLALEHDPTSTEAADSLTDRLADEQRWSELVRLVRTRIAMAEPARAVALHLRLADVFVHQLGDPAAAQRELAAARGLSPDDPAVHEMTATILVASDRAGAIAAWREVARLAEQRGDHGTGARAWARLGGLLADPAAGSESRPLHLRPGAESESRPLHLRPGAENESRPLHLRPGTTSDGRGASSEDAWRRSLELDPMQADALVGLASSAAERNDHAIAVDLYERLRGVGLAQAIAARHELALARSLIALGRIDDARTSLRRAALAGGEPAAEAHAMLAEVADATLDRDHAAAELDTAISSLVELAAGSHPDSDRLYARAAELAVARATLFDRGGQTAAAGADWQRAHALARQAAPEIARDAARTLLARSGDDASLERRWIDAVLATRPPPAERAALLVRRADVRRRERFPDLAAALADLHEAVELTEEAETGGDTGNTGTRRRAYEVEAELFAQNGDQRARASSLAAIARLAERGSDRVETETAAAAAWLLADEPAAALPHGARAHASLAATSDVPPTLRREVLVTLGEAAWRQRAWPDVIRAYRGLLDDPGPEAHRLTAFRYRLAVAADRVGDGALALVALRPLVDDPDATRGASPELRAHALRLFADVAERAGELAAAAAALEGHAAIGGDSTATARADAVFRAGELFRRIDRGDDAIRCLETALRISDTHLPALDALEVAWRERGDLERVAVILGRKVAATARHPARQKPLLSRLGDLQDQLRRHDVALATHQRALEIDPMWRPSLRYVTLRLRDTGQVVAAAGGLAQLAGQLHGDQGTDLAIVARERQIAAEALSELVARLDDAQVEAVRSVARPALERAALDGADVEGGLARLRGEAAPVAATPHSEDDTQSGRVALTRGPTLRETAARARASGKLEEAFAILETANHVSPGDTDVLRDLVEIATELHDHNAAARHLAALALRLTGPRRGDALLELADVFYDRLDDAARGREAMRRAAEAFGSGARRDATLRLLATEAGTHLAWDIAVESLLAIPLEKRTQADFTSLAMALMRAGRDADALAAIEAATAAHRFDDDGDLLHQIRREIQRKTDLARSLEERATGATGDEAIALREEAQQLRAAIGQPGHQPLRDTAAPEGEFPKSDTAPWPVRTKTKPGVPNKQVQPAPVGSRPRDSTQPLPPGGPPEATAAGSSPAIAVPGAGAARSSSPTIIVAEDLAAPRGLSVAGPGGAETTPATAAGPAAGPAAAQRPNGDGAAPAAAPADTTSATGSSPPSVTTTAAGSPAVPAIATALAAPLAAADDDGSAIPELAGAGAGSSGILQVADRERALVGSAAMPAPGADDASADDDSAEITADRRPVAPPRTSRPGSQPPVRISRERATVEPSAEPPAHAAESDADATRITARWPAVRDPDPDATRTTAPWPAVPPPPAPPAVVESRAPDPLAADDAAGGPQPDVATARSPSRDPAAPVALGRIKLVARTTRPGVAPPRPTGELAVPPLPPESEEAGDWQSVSDPDLKSGPWLPPGADLPPRPARTTSSPSRSTRSRAASEPPPPAASASEPPPPAAAASEPPLPTAAAEPPLPTAAEPPLPTAAAEPPLPAAAEPPLPAAAEPPLPAAAEPPLPTATDEPPLPAAADELPAAADELPAAADELPLPTAAAEPPLPTNDAEPPLPTNDAVESIRSREPSSIASLIAEDTAEPALSRVPTERTAEPRPLGHGAPGPVATPPMPEPADRAVESAQPVTPSVTITGTPEETALALLRAAASADRERLFAARRADPDDPAVLLALLAHLGEREPTVRRELLDEVVRTSHGRALAIALHELAVLAREARDAARATALWTRAYETDPSYPPVWMPLADAFAASDDYAAARELYEAIARSDSYDSTRRAFAAERVEALGKDDAIVSGEIAPRGMTDLEEAEQLAASEDWPGAIDAAERAAAARPEDRAVLEALERIYLASGNVTAASEAIGRQLMLIDEPPRRAALWRRRARMYRDALGRDAEAYRCLKEAHACSPADPEIAYQLRTAAMVRGEWQLAGSLMYREIAAAAHPRDRGALHLELAMIYEERLDDAAQAQANYEQALAFDPTIPAVKLPLARRYEAIGRSSDAARLYEEAAGTARPADRASLLEAAARCRQAATDAAEPDLAAQLDHAEAAGDLDAALELADQLWRAEPGHPAAFRVLANVHRTSGDLAALTELTSQRVGRAETPDERATAWLEVARLAEEIGALDQAARAYDLSLIQDPGHIGALDARGALAFRLGDFATADLIYRDLGSGESVLGDDELALRRSIIAEQLGRDTEALQLAQVAASLAPGRRDIMMRVQELATRVGDLIIALAAARHILELIPIDDDEAQLATQFNVVELLREAGQLDDAVAQLEKILRDHPMHSGAIEALAQVHTARGDWQAATRYLYQLVPLAPSPGHRAERLYQLGEAVLVHVNDIDRADDVFLRASDLDPGHVPTLRRLLDVYWRADDPGGIVEVATELADKGALVNGPTPESALARALIAAALIGDVDLAQQVHAALGDAAARHIAEALTELAGRSGRLQLGTASTAIAELARRGYLDLAKLRAATAGTPAANTL